MGRNAKKGKSIYNRLGDPTTRCRLSFIAYEPDFVYPAHRKRRFACLALLAPEFSMCGTSIPYSTLSKKSVKSQENLIAASEE